MTVMQSLDGKFYEIPEDQAVSFEIPRDKVKDLLNKMPAPQGAPQGGQGPQSMGPNGGGQSPVIVQIFPNGMNGPAQGPSGGAPKQGGDGDVEPYWWWNNYRYGNYWSNYWNNW